MQGPTTKPRRQLSLRPAALRRRGKGDGRSAAHDEHRDLAERHGIRRVERRAFHATFEDRTSRFRTPLAGGECSKQARHRACKRAPLGVRAQLAGQRVRQPGAGELPRRAPRGPREPNDRCRPRREEALVADDVELHAHPRGGLGECFVIDEWLQVSGFGAWSWRARARSRSVGAALCALGTAESRSVGRVFCAQRVTRVGDLVKVPNPVAERSPRERLDESSTCSFSNRK